MTTPESDNLDKQLTDLTRWHGASPQVWRKALRATGKRIPLLSRVLVGAVAACIVFGFVGLFAWQFPRGSARRGSQADGRSDSALRWYSINDGDAEAAIDIPKYGSAAGVSVASVPTPDGMSKAEPSDRKVIRRVTIQLSTPDVRAAYLKASHLISEAKREFVQDSALTGSDNALQANLTLRVAADRLPEVLNQLRELGKVDAEQANGEDVTQQVVDNDARLRNEQRIEAEMLKLLDTRQNAPLTELLQLRDKLSEVRNSIERMVAERDRLGRLVNLATVLVIIRPAGQPVAVETSLRDYFTQGIARAWNQALRLLADTVALLVGVVVGGLIWWCLLAIVIVLVVRFWRRRATH